MNCKIMVICQQLASQYSANIFDSIGAVVHFTLYRVQIMLRVLICANISMCNFAQNVQKCTKCTKCTKCMCTVYWINCKIMVICRNKCTRRKYVIISGQLLYVWGANVLQLIFNIIQYKFIIVKYKLITVQYMFIIVQYNFIIIQYKFKINIYVIRAAAVCMGC